MDFLIFVTLNTITAIWLIVEIYVCQFIIDFLQSNSTVTPIGMILTSEALSWCFDVRRRHRNFILDTAADALDRFTTFHRVSKHTLGHNIVIGQDSDGHETDLIFLEAWHIMIADARVRFSPVKRFGTRIVVFLTMCVWAFFALLSVEARNSSRNVKAIPLTFTPAITSTADRSRITPCIRWWSIYSNLTLMLFLFQHSAFDFL